MNTYLLFLCGEAPWTPPFAIFLQINYLQLKVHNPQFLLNFSLREEIPLPLPHVLDTFFSLFLMLGLFSSSSGSGTLIVTCSRLESSATYASKI
jgi:hypothetical protein